MTTCNKQLTTLTILTTLLLIGCDNQSATMQDDQEIEQPQILAEETTQNIYILFTLNTQEFMEPEMSLETLENVMELHEKYDIPLDIYFADFLTQKFAEDYQYIFETLKSDDMWAVSYHVRAPLPYAGSSKVTYDWDLYSPDELRSLFMQYETYTMDWVLGELTDQPGGYGFLKELIGYAPLGAGISDSNDIVEDTLVDIYTEMGATFAVQHIDGFGSSDIDYGEYNGELLIRPEHQEIRLFELSSAEAIDTIEDFISKNYSEGGKDLFINIKMHDKDFFATDSAWSLIYSRQTPPYDLSVYEKAVEFLTNSEREAVLSKYEAVLEFIAEDSRFTAVNLLDVSQMSPL